jgi:hypothetical protein
VIALKAVRQLHKYPLDFTPRLSKRWTASATHVQLSPVSSVTTSFPNSALMLPSANLRWSAILRYESTLTISVTDIYRFV